MKGSKITLPLLFLALLGLNACKKDDNFSEVPHIEYKDFVAMGDSAHIILNFTDGDGDLGLGDSDTAGNFRYNCFIRYFEKQNGTFVERTFSPPFNFRIPVLNDGKAKALSGEIKVSVAPFYYDFLSDFDTIRYEIYVKDKALNESNHITTPEIITP